MPQTVRSPEELLPYRTIKQFLQSRAGVVHSVTPRDSALSALKSMAEKHIGLLVVIDEEKLAGVLSERDLGRRVTLAGRTMADTPVGDIMTRDVVTVTPADRFGDCLRLMDRHGFRHLPVVESGLVVGVVSVRDLMREAVAHHEKVIRDLELERMAMFNSPV
jgi:CBS domain-containing protein